MWPCGRTWPGWPREAHARTTLEAQLGELGQGRARVIDRDAEALMEKQAFAPRLTRLRPRIAPVEAPRHGAAQAALDPRGRAWGVEELPRGSKTGWRGPMERKRALTRALGTRVEVAHDPVNVGCRIAPRPGDPSPEKKSLTM